MNFDISNISEEDLNVRVRRTEISLIQGTVNVFCWAGLCYPPFVDESPNSVIIPSGTIHSDDFSAHYNPNSMIGTSTIMYTFFDDNNPSDSVCFIAEFIIQNADGLNKSHIYQKNYTNTKFQNSQSKNNYSCDIYGGLYQWNEMMEYTTFEGAQGICPEGWHVPTDDEWCTMTQFIDFSVNCNSINFSGTDVGDKMKSTSGWNSYGNGSNTSGFSALPGGSRLSANDFAGLGNEAYFWTSTNYYIGQNAWYRGLNHGIAAIFRSNVGTVRGKSVRCVKD